MFESSSSELIFILVNLLECPVYTVQDLVVQAIHAAALIRMIHMGGLLLPLITGS